MANARRHLAKRRKVRETARQKGLGLRAITGMHAKSGQPFTEEKHRKASGRMQTLIVLNISWYGAETTGTSREPAKLTKTGQELVLKDHTIGQREPAYRAGPSRPRTLVKKRQIGHTVLKNLENILSKQVGNVGPRQQNGVAREHRQIGAKKQQLTSGYKPIKTYLNVFQRADMVLKQHRTPEVDTAYDAGRHKELLHFLKKEQKK